MLRAEVELTVPFHDIDLLNIAWHGHYCKYIEIARCAMLDKIGYGYMTMKETGYVWPIVDLQLRYVRPAQFEQRILVSAELVEWEYRMKIKYLVADAETGEVLAKGHTIQAAVDAVSREMCFASPPVFLEKLGIKIEAQ
ncbi:acyl-CoA thioesterase [Methylomonas sp. 2BW1-5-20]|uniref:acyl-CoA thioesterase n=1 Tax=Methylomonas sp. 2BW1-5-20 TaxID=3376686 RepID=UPI0040526D4F